MTDPARDQRPTAPVHNAGQSYNSKVHNVDIASSNTVVRNPAPDAAPPIAMPQIYGSFTLTR